jgi:hydrogenase maturation protease
VTERDRRDALVIGLGNELRGDDRVGFDVVRRLLTKVDSTEVELLEMHGEPTGLLERWVSRRAVVLVDAMHSGAPPGTIRRFDAVAEPLLQVPRSFSSTHALSLGDVIELARTLAVLPARLTVYAVEGRSFEAGSLMSDEVGAAISRVVMMICEEILR